MSDGPHEPRQPRSPRDLAIDYFRGAIVVAIVACHSVRAYQWSGTLDRARYWLSSGPIVDDDRWIGFDAFLTFFELWVMPMLFFVSALFVWPSLRRRGSAAFLRERWRRLGVPFVVAVAVLAPVAYYASFRAAGGEPGFLSFVRQSARSGVWPSGPAWFNWTLFAFGAGAALAYALAPRARALGAETRAAPETSWSRRPRRPAPFFALLVAATAVVYLPLVVALGPNHWFAFGPFIGQSNRLPSYAVFFAAGAWLGASGLGGGLLAADGWLATRWRRAILIAALSWVAVVAMQLDRLNRWIAWPPGGWDVVYSLVVVLASAAVGFAVLAVFLRFARRPVDWFDSFCRSAYGVYLVHFVFIIWTQYGLLGVELAAPFKAAAVFVLTLGASWLATAALRRIPAVARIL